MSKINIDISAVDFQNQNEVSEILALLNLTFSSSQFTNEWWKWKYLDNPVSKPLGYKATNKNNNQIIGVRFLWPWLVGNNNNVKTLYQAVDTAVHTKFQQNGIFGKLIQYSKSEINKINSGFFNFPNSNSLPGNLQNGWKIIAQPRWHYFFNSLPLLQRNRNKINQYRIDTDFTLKYIQQFDNKYRILWSEELLKWRFKCSPHKNYYCFQNKEGICVFRLDKKYSILFVRVLVLRYNEKEFLSDLKKFYRSVNLNIIAYCGLDEEFMRYFSKKSIGKFKHGKANFVTNLNNNMELIMELGESDFM